MLFLNYTQINGREEIVTHRIVQIGGNVYLTKGDNNIAVDQEKVVPRLIIGKVVFIIPDVGYLLFFAKTKAGLWLTIILPALSIIVCEIVKLNLIYPKLSRFYQRTYKKP